jgi:hypothetical protein
MNSEVGSGSEVLRRTSDYPDDDGVAEINSAVDGGEENGVLWQDDESTMADGDSGEVLWRADDFDTRIRGDDGGEVLWRADDYATGNRGDDGGEVLWRADDYGTSGEDGGEVLWRADDFDAGSECGDAINNFGNGPATCIGRTDPTATYVQHDWSGTSLRSTVSVHLLVFCIGKWHSAQICSSLLLKYTAYVFACLDFVVVLLAVGKSARFFCCAQGILGSVTTAQNPLSSHGCGCVGACFMRVFFPSVWLGE